MFSFSLFSSSSKDNVDGDVTANAIANTRITSSDSSLPTDLDNITIEELETHINMYEANKGYGRKFASAVPTMGVLANKTEFMDQLIGILNEEIRQIKGRRGSLTAEETVILIKFLDDWTKDMVPNTLSYYIHFNLLTSANRTTAGRNYRMGLPLDSVLVSTQGEYADKPSLLAGIERNFYSNNQVEDPDASTHLTVHAQDDQAPGSDTTEKPEELKSPARLTRI